MAQAVHEFPLPKQLPEAQHQDGCGSFFVSQPFHFTSTSHSTGSDVAAGSLLKVGKYLSITKGKLLVACQKL